MGVNGLFLIHTLQILEHNFSSIALMQKMGLFHIVSRNRCAYVSSTLNSLFLLQCYTDLFKAKQGIK